MGIRNFIWKIIQLWETTQAKFMLERHMFHMKKIARSAWMINSATLILKKRRLKVAESLELYSTWTHMTRAEATGSLLRSTWNVAAHTTLTAMAWRRRRKSQDSCATSHFKTRACAYSKTAADSSIATRNVECIACILLFVCWLVRLSRSFVEALLRTSICSNSARYCLMPSNAHKVVLVNDK